MSDAKDQRLLEDLLDSWDRNNTIMVNLLRALPEGGLEARAMEGSPSIAEGFTHIHYLRLVFVLEDAPEFTRSLPEEEWAAERDRDRIAQMLNFSGKVLRDAVRNGVESGQSRGASGCARSEQLMEHSFACPHCGEEISMVLDLSVRRQTYLEDCEVCCNPIEISYTVSDEELAEFSARTLG